MNIRLAKRMSQVKPSAIRELLRLGADPSIMSFGGGYPDASLFPLEQLEAVFRASIAGNGRETLQYTVSNGSPKLREQIATRMTRDGITCGADNVLILQGGQQGLDLVAKMLVDKGDVIVTENPTFLGALIAFNPCEPRYAAVRMDDDGMDMDDLERTLERNPGAKLIYTVPDFQNPTGVTLSLDRRKKLVELANRFDLVVLEDTPYREIRYQGEPIPPIKSFDTEGRVIYLGSFSKILAPGLRLGWAVASEELTQQLGLLKLAADTQCSTLNMAAVSLFLEKYDIDAHIASIRQIYRHKKDLMLDTIRRTFPQDVAFTEPSGGLFTWLTFPEGFDTARFMADHALPEAKVAYVPGATFFPLQQEVNHARVSYSTQTDEVIVQGITALGKLLTARRNA
ncbi:2-aminoadipate transaminase [Mesorhizobium soli]|uniref:aminotransferase-like domain-containing protein n=1 Tax=Pseudaminobacter soli (ex Li et al. 2025) TaxID=1295366 RepID=UPI002475D20A|nr:PLP-dependent aminotransferase family protein [Mesorhizobium soli]MDH6231825.1 2-aminoadipate transaminase [Mesorhizobium soli]